MAGLAAVGDGVGVGVRLGVGVGVDGLDGDEIGEFDAEAEASTVGAAGDGTVAGGDPASQASNVTSSAATSGNSPSARSGGLTT